MDFVRHNAKVFYDNKLFDTTYHKYIPYALETAHIKKTHSCFFHAPKHKFTDRHFVPKNKPKPCFIHKTEENFPLFLRSSLNKLTHANFKRICTVVKTKMTDEHLYTTVKTILKSSFESILFSEVYVGMLLDIFASSTKKRGIDTTVVEYFSDIFRDDFYMILEQTIGETYDDFCGRVKSKRIVIHKIKTYFLLYQDKEFAKVLDKPPHYVFNLIFQHFENLNLDNSHDQSLEQVIDCLSECVCLHPTLVIPSTTLSVTRWKKVLNLTPRELHTYVEAIETYSDLRCTSNRLRFKCLDLVNLIKQLQK